MGIFQGYWTTFLSVAAELFGTNLRATVSTSVPNFVRASTVPINYVVFGWAASNGFIASTLFMGFFVYSFALIALALLRESYGKDLNFVER
jgi:MFS transporter, putative metabolite:H+ symporter